MRMHVNFSVVLPVFARVARELQRRYGVTGFSGFVYGRDSLHDLDRLNFPRDGVRALTDALRAHGDRDPDLEYLAERERLYGDPNLYLMIAGCRFASQFEHRRALQVLEVGFRLIEQLFDEHRPVAVISDGVACTLSYVQFVVARARRIPFLTIAPARVNGRFYILRNHRDRYERVDALYARYKEEGLCDDDRARAERFVADFRAAATKPDYLKFATVPGFDVESLRTLGRLIYRRYALDPANYLLASPFEALRGRLLRIAKTRVLDRPHFENEVPREKFVFFPLHFQPELTTLILAPYAVNQIAVIENLAKTLPIDHVLCVKEHKASLGRRPLGYYAAIRRLPNVRLVSPYLDSHELVKRSSAVCVISSTVGWEAILYEKPVVTIGDVCYNSFDLVSRVRSWEEVPYALRAGIDRFAPDHELLLKYVAATLNGTYAGDVFHPPGAATSPSLAPDNISDVADAIASELGIAAGNHRAPAPPIGVS
jgi:hypothetical protein